MPASDALTDLAGAVHMHTRYSDGTGTVADIARAGAANGLDFLLLTDHDTLAARDNGEQGWHRTKRGNVLVAVGEEVSPLRRNHYLAFGLERPIDHSNLTPGQIVEAVNAAGGFGFPAHPFSKGSERFKRGGEGMPWDDIDAPGYTGIELWSFVTDTAENVNSVGELLRFIAAPARFVTHPPKRNLEQWDRICASRRCVAIGGIDAHQIGLRVGPWVPLRLMSYKRSFRYLHTHVLCEQPLSGDSDSDREAIYVALRAGHTYIAMDGLQPASGFRFWAEGANAIEMGDEASAGRYELRVELPAPAQLRLLRNGEPIATVAHTATITHGVDEPGVYRVEAHLRTHGKTRTWILSNPIYLR